MIGNDSNRCPVCKSRRYVSITATGGEWTSLVTDRYGSTHLNACVDCGIIYFPESERRRIQRDMNEKERKK